MNFKNAQILSNKLTLSYNRRHPIDGVDIEITTTLYTVSIHPHFIFDHRHKSICVIARCFRKRAAIAYPQLMYDSVMSCV